MQYNTTFGDGCDPIKSNEYVYMLHLSPGYTSRIHNNVVIYYYIYDVYV